MQGVYIEFGAIGNTSTSHPDLLRINSQVMREKGTHNTSAMTFSRLLGMETEVQIDMK